MRRYETRSTIMTSNRPLEDWGKLLGDVPSATAILDRFLHHAEIVRITGKSYRLRNQKVANDESAEDSKPAIPPAGPAENGDGPKPAIPPTGPKRRGAGSKPAIPPTGPTVENEGEDSR
jgi:hypothetical protein